MLQDEKFRELVTGEMTMLRKSLVDDFDRQRSTLLAAFNEEISRALKTSSRQSVGPETDGIDLRSDLERHRRQLDDELKRRLADSVVEVKHELTMTLKEQEKDLLKMMIKSKPGNEVPKR